MIAEARAANLIRSEHLVAITDLARDPERATYLVMELLEGEDLQRLLSAGPIDVRRSLRLVRQLCTVVAEVHAVGLVHRDLKPENIFVTRRGGGDFLKLLDFGIAKRFDVEVPGRHNTAPGLLVGTPEYMSPEQALGGRVDWRTDVHALGVILFELLTRRRPYAHQSPGLLLHEIAFSAPPQLRDHARLPRCIAAPLEALVTRCLDKDPSARPQSAEEVGAAVDALLRELGDSAAHRSLTPGPGARTGPAAMQGASPEDAAHTPESELAVSWGGARHSLSLRRARSLAWLMAAGLAAAAAAVASVGWLGGESAHPAIAQGLHPAPALTRWGIHGPAKTGTGQLGAPPNPTLPGGLAMRLHGMVWAWFAACVLWAGCGTPTGTTGVALTIGYAQAPAQLSIRGYLAQEELGSVRLPDGGRELAPDMESVLLLLPDSLEDGDLVTIEVQGLDAQGRVTAGASAAGAVERGAWVSRVVTLVVEDRGRGEATAGDDASEAAPAGSPDGGEDPTPSDSGIGDAGLGADGDEGAAPVVEDGGVDAPDATSDAAAEPMYDAAAEAEDPEPVPPEDRDEDDQDDANDPEPPGEPDDDDDKPKKDKPKEDKPRAEKEPTQDEEDDGSSADLTSCAEELLACLVEAPVTTVVMLVSEASEGDICAVLLASLDECARD